MRHIQVEAGLRLRFSGRSDEFSEGVEIGLLAARMAAGYGEFTALIAPSTLDQARAMAVGFGYRIHVVRFDENSAEIMLLTGSRRPKLSLVYSATRLV